MEIKINKASFDLKKIKIKLPAFSLGKMFGLAQNRDRDWKIILWATVIILITISLLSYQLFLKVDSGAFLRGSEEINEKAKTLDRRQLEKAVNIIQKTQIEFESSFRSGPNTSDPFI